MLKNSIDSFIAESIKSGMKAQAEVLRGIKTVFTTWEKANPGKELTEAEELKLLLKMQSQRQDSIEQYKIGHRPDLVEQETAELTILNKYIPAQASDEDVQRETENICEHLIAENGGLSMRDMKQVLSLVQAKYPTATGKVVSQVVKSKITE